MPWRDGTGPLGRGPLTGRGGPPVPSSFEAQGEDRFEAGPGGGRDRAAVEPHDLAGQAEPDARAAVLGREEGDEDLVEVLGGDAGSVVPDLEDRYDDAYQSRIHVRCGDIHQ